MLVRPYPPCGGAAASDPAEIARQLPGIEPRCSAYPGATRRRRGSAGTVLDAINTGSVIGLRGPLITLMVFSLVGVAQWVD